MEYRARFDLHDFTASSAGTRAMVGHPIQPAAARVLTRLGGEASNFAARQFNPRILSGVDLVLTMTRAQRDDVLELAPQKLHQIFTLAEAARLVSDCGARTFEELAAFRPLLRAQGQLDIADPMGRNEEFFEWVGVQISELLPPVLELCVSHQSSSAT